MKSLDHIVVLFLFFWGTPLLSSIMTTPIYISTNTIQMFLFLHILANICYFWSFWWQLLWQVWGGISLWFWFAFPWWLAILSIFSCGCWPSVCLLWKNIYTGLLLLFNWVVFFDAELNEVFKPLNSHSICKYFIYERESHSVVSDSVTPWTIQSMEFSRPEHWSG